jgi:tRNA(fMet)-specific endonuclease VapC
VTYLLDTNVCIAYLTRRSPRLAAQIRSLSPRDLVLCSVVKAELLYGARKSAKVEANLARLGAFFAPLTCLPFDDLSAEHYGLIRAELEQRGTPVGPNDLMIAAIARAHGLTLVTANLDEFGRVPALRVEDWS